MTEKMKIKLTVIFLSLLMLAAIVASICIAACGVGTHGDGQNIIRMKKGQMRKVPGMDRMVRSREVKNRRPGRAVKRTQRIPRPYPMSPTNLYLH